MYCPGFSIKLKNLILKMCDRHNTISYFTYTENRKVKHSGFLSLKGSNSFALTELYYFWYVITQVITSSNPWISLVFSLSAGIPVIIPAGQMAFTVSGL